MKGFLRVPASVYCLACKDCGAMPVIVPVEDIGYSVKCPDNDNHYHTPPGLIDIQCWNFNNTPGKIPASFDPSSLFAL